MATIAVRGRPTCCPAPPAAEFSPHLLHATSESLRRMAADLCGMADGIRRYEPLTLDAHRKYVGECLRAGAGLCDAWRDLTEYRCGRRQ